MSGSMIPSLQAQRQSYVNKIADTREEIARYEKAYESLTAFKATVSQSQEEFHSINASKAALLAQVEGVEKNSLLAQQYREGMQNIFDKTAVGVVGTMYVLLLTSISTKLQLYENLLNSYEATLASCHQKIADVDRQIAAAERAEAAAARKVGSRR